MRGKRILIVEDNFLISNELVEILRREEAVVEGPIGEAPAALDFVNTHSPDGHGEAHGQSMKGTTPYSAGPRQALPPGSPVRAFGRRQDFIVRLGHHCNRDPGWAVRVFGTGGMSMSTTTPLFGQTRSPDRSGRVRMESAPGRDHRPGLRPMGWQ